MENYNPKHPPLTETEVLFASQAKILQFPEVVRTESDPPISGQNFVGLSIITLKEPRKLRDGSTAFGFVKIRGVGSSADDVERIATNLVKNVDSKHPILIGQVGKWLPFTTSTKNLVQETVELSDDKKSAEAAFSSSDIQKGKAEENKIVQELKRREVELKTQGDIYDDVESIKFYTMKKVVEERLQDEISRVQKQLDSFNRKLGLVRDILAKLDEMHPTYINEWVDCYNFERKRTNVPEYIPRKSVIDSYAMYRANTPVSEASLKELIERSLRD